MIPWVSAGVAAVAVVVAIVTYAITRWVDPQAYIADVIAKVAGDWPASRWDELMPWNWMPQVDQSTAQAA